jgi:hypothetical protein
LESLRSLFGSVIFSSVRFVFHLAWFTCSSGETIKKERASGEAEAKCYAKMFAKEESAEPALKILLHFNFFSISPCLHV